MHEFKIKSYSERRAKLITTTHYQMNLHEFFLTANIKEKKNPMNIQAKERGYQQEKK